MAFVTPHIYQNMISKTNLLQILSDTESYYVERTVSTTNTDKFSQAICAFSNDIAGSGKNGYLIIGAKDNGDLSGLTVDDKLLLQIANIRTDGNILPQPIITVEKFSFNEGDVLVAEVPPQNSRPYAADFDLSLVTAFRVTEPISQTYFNDQLEEKSPTKAQQKPKKLTTKAQEILRMKY